MMKHLFPIWIALMAVCSVAATHVAVLETISEKGVIGRSERLFLTDELRKQAKNTLPEYMGFVIMTRENITQMLPEGMTIEDCEGTCLVETGKNISAEYVAQARVGKLGKKLTLTMELYETASSNLVGSFTARKSDVEGLFEEIEREAGNVFSKILGVVGTVAGENEGITGVSFTGGGFRASGLKSYIVHVESSPTGAMFSVDGRVNASCNKTPCDMTLIAGTHRFSFSMDMYFDKDETIDIQKNGQKVLAELVPNFGELTLAPLFDEGMGKLDEADVLIDDRKVQGTSLRLSAGSHKVQISHQCYDTVSFNVGVKTGSKIIFDQKIIPVLGGLELDALQNGKPKALPVYVNGRKLGETPFLETVPVCAKIQIGPDREMVSVKLKAGEMVRFTYKKNTNAEEIEVEENNVLVDERDGKAYYIVKIGNQIWMAENLNYETKNSYCYKDNPEYCEKYGRLYTWKSARKVCPNGWHLPNLAEWKTLLDMVGGNLTANQKLKTKKGWKSNGNGTDVFGFSALPSGYRNDIGIYSNMGDVAYFWSFTEYDGGEAYHMLLKSKNDNTSLDYSYKSYGFSVRCFKD